MNSPDPERVRASNRIKLLLVIGLFALPALIAVVLGAFGWQPGVRGHGEPILPQRSLADIRIDTSDGAWAWRDSEPRMTLLALPGPDCAAKCIQTLGLVRNARIVLNRHADRLRLLYLGPSPTGADAGELADWTFGQDNANALAGFRSADADSVALVLVESNGTALSLYRAGFDPNGLRKDLQKVVK